MTKRQKDKKTKIRKDNMTKKPHDKKAIRQKDKNHKECLIL